MNVESSNLEEIDEWQFPEIIAKSDDIEQVELAQEKQKNEEIEKELEKQKKVQLENLINTYNDKIKLLDQIILKSQECEAIVDEELIKILHHILKKCVKQIVLKEISAEPDLLKEMILTLKNLLNEKKGIINIDISTEDYVKLDDEQFKQIQKIKPDSSLQSGDIIIQANSAEIKAILDDRISSMLDDKT